MKISKFGGLGGYRGKSSKFFEKIWKPCFQKKKFFFLQWAIQGVSGGPPGEGKKFLHPPMGREMIKTLTLINLGSKSRFYYISRFGPIFRSENPVDVSTLIFYLFCTILAQKNEIDRKSVPRICCISCALTLKENRQTASVWPSPRLKFGRGLSVPSCHQDQS